MNSTRRITDFVTTPDGICPITLVTPDGDGQWPGIVMYPDVRGVRGTFHDMAAVLAINSYAVLVPDVYYRHGPWEQFDMEKVFSDKRESDRLTTLMTSVTQEAMAIDATAFFDYLAARPDVSGEKFGITGYCMGGQVAIVVAGLVPDRVAAAMSFHGAGLVTDGPASPHLNADRIRAQVYVGGAENDDYFTEHNAETLGDSFTSAGVVHLIEIYPAAHGFAVPDNSAHDEAAAARHWDVTREFFGAAFS